MDGHDATRLTRLLGDRELRWLVVRARRRLEAGRPLEGSVTLPDATDAQRRAVERLVGRAPRPGRTLSLSFDRVDAVLRASGVAPDGLAAAVVSLSGPVVVRADAARTATDAWELAYAPVTAAVDRAASAPLRAWWEAVQSAGGVKRLEPEPARAAVLLARLAAVVDGLPADAEPLGVLASRATGGAHGLDNGQPLASLALGAARALSGLEQPRPSDSLAEDRRETWAAVGVLCDALSSVVLSVGLAAASACGTGRILSVGSAAGEPAVLTLRQLVREPPVWGPDVRRSGVRICENPVVLAAAADRLGTSCAPVVCTSGQPSAAVMVLLRSLADAAVPLSHHGDFDWGGVRIGNVLRARLPVGSWRFSLTDYERAVARGHGAPLAGRPAAATWDAALDAAMKRSGSAVEEEAVLDELLSDLVRDRDR